MKFLFVFAHPDDETFGPSGTILHYAQQGVEIHLLTLTHGESGSLGICKTLTKPETARLRKEELKCAARVLQITQLKIGDFSDGELANTPDIEGVRFISAELDKIQPDLVVTFQPEGITGHTDHITVSRWTTSAVKKANFSIKLFYYGLSEKQTELITHRKMHSIQDSKITHEIEVSKYLSQVKKAIECHASQVEIYNDLQKVSGGFDEVHKIETFMQVLPRQNNGDLKNSLI